MPSNEHSYVFNGDFVDRGKKGMEVLLIVYAFKLVYPTTVTLNRGNHEQKRINGKYGFEDEVRTKYDTELFDLIQKTFSLLPLCAVIEKKIFVVHGGLFAEDGVTIEELKK
jgi:serine/threonine-protein phosphatase 5